MKYFSNGACWSIGVDEGGEKLQKPRTASGNFMFLFLKLLFYFFIFFCPLGVRGDRRVRQKDPKKKNSNNE